MKPGDALQEGVVVRQTDAGVFVGRQAEPGEVCPPRHTEHTFAGKKVFLADDQAPIPPAGLHPKKPTRRSR